MIGVSHISTLGSKEAIAKAKLEILTGMNPEGILICNGDEPLIKIGLSELNVPETLHIIQFGESRNNDYYPVKQMVSGEGIHFIDNNAQQYFIPMLGKHNILNALASIAAGKELHIPLEKISDGFKKLNVTDMRMQQIKTQFGYTVINDAWNASPASMLAAIQTMIELTGYKKKLLVLGDMLELGADEIEYHKDIGHFLNNEEIDYVYTIGRLSNQISDQLYNKFPHQHVKHFTSKNELVESIKKVIGIDDVILVKGSRGMKLEEVVKEMI
jgi:UDP-N-acetylmuramoyl-tripeptide--D-alanyl-D-alanine ligase